MYLSSGIKELVKAALLNAINIVIPEAGMIKIAGSTVGHGIKMYEAHKDYVFAFNGVKKLT